MKARSVLEIGTLAGYSTIWLARALPADGRLVSLELDPKHAELARANLALAKVDDRVEIRLGRAIETFPQLVSEGAGPFDLIFIDADKSSTSDYFAWSLQLSRPGTMIVVDNVIRGGGIADPNRSDPDVVGVRRFFDAVAAEPRVSATAIQTVGSKGYDGLAILVVQCVGM
jgi:predicted O-methyltransferase YrrM